jgi:hypothetical protein
MPVEGLSTPHHVQVRPHGQHWPHVAARLFATPLEDEFEAGRVIADGSAQKTVYAIVDEPELILRSFKDESRGGRGVGQDAWSRAWIAVQEYHDLNLLEQRGFPVLPVIRTGTFEGRPADVVERFSMSDRDAVVAAGQPTRNAKPGDARRWEQPAVAARMFTPSSRRCLLQIRRAILAGTAVRDLQFLIKPGKVVVFDPAGIVLREEDPRAYRELVQKNLAHVDRLLAACPA